MIDEHGRRPLFTTQQDTRPSGDSISKWVVRALHPCTYAEFPHGRTLDEWEPRGRNANLAQCSSARSPHTVRRGAITHHLNQEASPGVVSVRMDVSLDVLDQHCDARTEREKTEVRRSSLPR